MKRFFSLGRIVFGLTLVASLIGLGTLGSGKAVAFKIDIPYSFRPVAAVNPAGDQVLLEFTAETIRSRPRAYIEASLIVYQPHTGAVASGRWRTEAGQTPSLLVRGELVEDSPPFEEGPVWAWYLAQHFDSRGRFLENTSNLVPVRLVVVAD